MVRADELYNEVTNDSSGKGASQGMFIGCFVDAATGFITFTCEGKDTSHKFKVILAFILPYILFDKIFVFVERSNDVFM